MQFRYLCANSVIPDFHDVRLGADQDFLLLTNRWDEVGLGGSLLDRVSAEVLNGVGVEAELGEAAGGLACDLKLYRRKLLAPGTPPQTKQDGWREGKGRG